MNFKAFAAALVTMSFLATPANALSITNEDEVAYSFDVIIGEDDAEIDAIELAAGESVSDVCPQGCKVKLPNGAEFSFEGNENVSIKNGVFMIVE
jgi:hypothetical protein